MSEIVPFGAAVVGDILSAFSLPGGNTLVTIAEGWLRKKREEAANIRAEVELVRAALATARAERVVAGNRTIEVARVRITDAGRQRLGE
jgi:hypothetical protein